MDPIYVGRQPIFDRKLDVFAYELLFRGHNRASSGPNPGDKATAEVLVNAVMDMGLENLVGTHPAFINVSAGFLDGRYPLPISPDHVGLEILEDVAPSEVVLETIAELRQRGYTIALDDFVYRPELEPLLELAHLVKLDVLALTEGELQKSIATLRGRPLKLVAEKVETHRELEMCRDLGFDYFQGYFLTKPQLMQGSATGTNRALILQLMARIQAPDAELQELENLIVQDVALTYRLLRHVNSAAFALRREVESVREAILFLGTNTIRNWASLILLTRMDHKPSELATTALIRAKMCERLAFAQRVQSTHAYFTTGLFSMLDAFMDRPLPELIATLPLTQAIKQAVLKFEGHLGATLQRVMWYENAAWDKLDDGQLDPGAYTRSYMEALRWANTSAHMLQGAA